jgi:5-methylcytosine-specific restriction endonuclease McrA
MNAQQRARRAANPEKIRAQQRAYSAPRLGQRRAWYAANLKQERARACAWLRAHPEVRSERHRRRRALKRNAPVNDLTHAQWIEIQAAQAHRCCFCGKRCKGKMTQEHLTPLSKGGSNTTANVVAACRSCNSKKGTNPAPKLVQPLLLTLAPAKPYKRRTAQPAEPEEDDVA